MRKNIRLTAFFLLLQATIMSYAQVVEAPYEVGTWKGFTEAAITYTFDDNTSNQYSVAIPTLNEFGFDATFYPVINWSPSWTNFQNAVDAGHEIGSHTVSHANLSELNSEEQDAELKNSQDEINAHISGQSCLTIAYPYCAPADDTITGKYYIAARHCQGYIEKSTPDDFLNISSIVCGTEGDIETADDFRENSDSAASLNGWSVYLLHGIDNDGGYSPVTSGVFRESADTSYLVVSYEDLSDEAMIISRAVSTGIPENANRSEVIVFPNPCNEVMYIQFESDGSPVSVKVIDMKGVLLLHETATAKKAEKGIYSINISHLPEGSYFLKIENSAKVFTDKIVILKN